MNTELENKDKLFKLAAEALLFIENHLTVSISVKEVTEKFERSHWQFQRLFRAVVGVSVGQYLRERRLSEAARMLRDTDLRILDIAVLYDFGSQEAFARSFKSFFQINPGEFRKVPGTVFTNIRNPITLDKLNYFWEKVQREPEIISLDEKILIGTKISFKSHFAEKNDCLEKIVPHWAEFKKNLHLITNRADEERIGVVLSLDLDLRCEELSYFSGVAVRSPQGLLPGMELLTLPRSEYACFDTQTEPHETSTLMDYVYGIWLPTSTYKRGIGYDLEIFDDRYNPELKTSMYRFLIPVC